MQEVFPPGIVLLRQAVSPDEQRQLIECVKRDSDLFKDAESGEWNFFGFRGRTYGKIKDELLKSCARRFRDEVEKRDGTLVFAPVTHVLTLWYPSGRGMGWHVDGYGGNDGDEGAPVYSLSVGNSCVFEYKLVGETEKHSVQLNGGDLFVFGGPQRLMSHRVKSVLPDTFEGFNARINFTLRTCSDMDDTKEALYQTDRYVERFRKGHLKSKE